MIALALSAAKVLVAWLLLFIVLSFFHAFVFDFVRKKYKSLPVQQRQSLSLLWLSAPAAIAILTLLLYSSPELSAYFVSNHCHEGDCMPHHLHLPTDSEIGMSTLIISLLAFLIFSVLLIRQLGRARRYLRLLNQLATHSDKNSYQIFETKQPLAWCAGFLNPQIYVSRGLLDKLSSEQLQFVLAHEYSHIIGHDNIKKLLVQWHVLFWPRKIAKKFKRDFHLDLEVICDLTASQSEINKVELTDVFTALGDEVNKDIAVNGKQHNCLNQAKQRLALYQQEQQINTPIRYSFVKHGAIFLSYFTATLLLAVVFSHSIIEWLLR